MNKLLLVLIFSLMIMAANAGDSRLVISEDGHQSVILNTDSPETPQNIITDIVPYNLSPDWICGVQVPVGGLAMGDLDGDGDNDLVVGCYGTSSEPPYTDTRNFILYNIDGQLESTPTWRTQDSSWTTDVRIADFNGDGYPDIFSANGGFDLNPSTINYYNTDTDSIQSQAGWYSSDNCWTTGAAAYDFDNDGDIDVATSNQGVYPDSDRPVNLFVNHSGNIEAYPSWSSGDEALSGTLAWGDYNNDGWYDLAVSKWTNWYSCVYRNNSGALSSYPVWQSDDDNMQKGIGWSDVDGDTYPELAIGGNSTPSELYPNNNGVLGASPIWEAQNSFYGCQDLAWSDVDGDGDEDLATVHFSNGHLRIYLNVNGVLDSSPSWQYDDPASGTALTFGDINGDGAVDLVMGVAGDLCVKVFYNTGQVSVDEDRSLPKTTKLMGNFPNPFNTETRISFYLDKPSQVKLRIYDLNGRLVNTLINNGLEAGYKDVLWDGRDKRGNPLATGIYFYRLETESGIQTKKMVFLK